MNLRIESSQGLAEAGASNRIDRMDRAIVNPGGADKTAQFGSELGKAIGEVLPDAVKGPLEKLYKGYTAVADITGGAKSPAAARR